MIENLLLDPKVIWDSIVTVRHKTHFDTLQSLETAIDLLLDDMEPREKIRRIKGRLGIHVFRPQEPFDDLKSQVDRHIDQLRASTNAEALDKAEAITMQELKVVREKKQRREYYDGKAVLNEFYKRECRKKFSFTNVPDKLEVANA